MTISDKRLEEALDQIEDDLIMTGQEAALRRLRELIAEASGEHIGYQLFDHSGRAQGQTFKAKNAEGAKHVAQVWSSQSGYDGGPYEAREIRAVKL